MPARGGCDALIAEHGSLVTADDPAAEMQWLPCAGDWMRAVQIGKPATSAPTAPTPARRKAPSRKKTT